jgi:hypothetical protein
MAQYRTLPGQLESLEDVAKELIRHIRASAIYLDEMDTRRSLVQNALEHNHLAEGQAVTVLRRIKALQTQVHVANGGNVLHAPQDAE